MPGTPRLAPSEWKIMRILWASPEPMPAYDIIQKLSESAAWHPKTIKTLLNRLVKKGALGYRTYKNLYLYLPTVSEEECVRRAGESFLKTCFDGALQPMLAHFVRTRKLTPEEIREIRRILDEGQGRHRQ